MGTKAKKNVA